MLAVKSMSLETRLRTAALIALPVSALGSVALLLTAGARNPSLLLKVLFSLWVLSPFAMLGLVEAVSVQWPVRLRSVLHGLMLAVALSSVATYTHTVVWPPKSQGAFYFVIVPPVSWLVIVIVVALASRARH
jgi:hypothetical protein